MLEMPGIYLCKYREIAKMGGDIHWPRPISGFDKVAMICGFAAGAMGLIATFLVMRILTGNAFAKSRTQPLPAAF
jgi:hypothetical protein